jgi:hypothetical protein
VENGTSGKRDAEGHDEDGQQQQPQPCRSEGGDLRQLREIERVRYGRAVDEVRRVRLAPQHDEREQEERGARERGHADGPGPRAREAREPHGREPPEDGEQEAVESHEHARRARLHGERRGERLAILARRRIRHEPPHGDGPDDGREQHEQQRHAVDAHEVLEADGPHERRVSDELKAVVAVGDAERRIEARDQAAGDHERRPGGGQGERPCAVRRRAQQEGGAEERQQDHPAEDARLAGAQRDARDPSRHGAPVPS